MQNSRENFQLDVYASNLVRLSLIIHDHNEFCCLIYYICFCSDDSTGFCFRNSIENDHWAQTFNSCERLWDHEWHDRSTDHILEKSVRFGSSCNQETWSRDWTSSLWTWNWILFLFISHHAIIIGIFHVTRSTNNKHKTLIFTSFNRSFCKIHWRLIKNSLNSNIYTLTDFIMFINKLQIKLLSTYSHLSLVWIQLVTLANNREYGRNIRWSMWRVIWND